ncbi:uncharacterized protein LOC111086696 [Limulus polyphemus]|uniref:Uncharacterized protein LOC111086696 n=1 Tax=Limulus polyphemus TaxID=6850 RepID=A0ABM1SRL9_LIMPO|nr:uncharacterized protein LOC111086696 [Limulus polyphemus]
MANTDGLVDSFVGSELSVKDRPPNSNLKTCIVTAVVGTDSHLSTDSYICEEPSEHNKEFDQTCTYTISKQDISVMGKEGQISSTSSNTLKRNNPESFTYLQKDFSKTTETVKTSVNSNSEDCKATAFKNSKKCNSSCDLKDNNEQGELKTVSKVMESFHIKNTTPNLVNDSDECKEKFFDSSYPERSNILTCQNIQSISFEDGYQIREHIQSNGKKYVSNFSQGLKLPTQGVALSKKLPSNAEVQENKKQTINEGTETTTNYKTVVRDDITTHEKFPTNNDVSGNQISVSAKIGANDSLHLSSEGKGNLLANTLDQECSYIDTCYENSLTDEIFSEMIRKAGFPAAFQDKVVIGKYIPIRLPKQKNFKLRENEALLQCPSMVTPLLMKKADKFPTKKYPSEMSDCASWNGNDKEDENDYQLIERFTKKDSPVDFSSSTSCRFLLGIGLSQAQEWCLKDQIRYKKRRIKKKGMVKKIAKDLELCVKMLKEASSANEPFVFPLKKCEFCDFKTESVHALEEHCTTVDSLLRKEYKCHFCGFCTKDPKALLFHIEALHNRKGKLECSSCIYFCTQCSFETNNKKIFKRHLNKCQKQHDGNYLSVQDTPAKSSMLTTMNDIKDYEEYLLSCRKESTHYSGISRSLKTVPPCNQKCCSVPFQKPVDRPQDVCFAAAGHGDLYQQRVRPIGTWHPMSNNSYLKPYQFNNIGPLTCSFDNPSTSCNSGTDASSEISPSVHIPFPANQIYQLISGTGKIIPVESGSSSSSGSYAPQYTLVSNSSGTRLVVDKTTTNPSRTGLISEKTNSPNIVPTRLQGPHSTEMTKQNSGKQANSEIVPSLNNTFVICEICDGYVKQLGHLRTHMYLIHKVEIQPKILQNRPPLNCQKCQWKFFTDQGLERHLLGAHGLVTTNMQELAKKKEDGGTCTICGRVYFSQLLMHMSQKHKIKLKPANLSYKCTVCSANFNFYGQFQTHVYSAHIGAIKRNTAGT